MIAAEGSADPVSGQDHVDSYFDATSTYWQDVYGDADLQGLVYRRRQEVALAWARAAELPVGAPVLDAGCGAGHFSAALAGAGLEVMATDSSPRMTELCARTAAQAGVSPRVHVQRADAHALPFADGEFALVTALGLLPWVADPATVVAELARVLAPGGVLIVTADNRYRLNRLIEPREQPLLAPVKTMRNRLLRRAAAADSVESYRHSARDVDAMLAAAGIVAERRTTVGYGPFTVFGRGALPDGIGTALHGRLEQLAQRHPRLRGSGWHYIVVGRKPPAAAGAPDPLDTGGGSR